jgi:glycosyltransferase involved in cell wall biosynthesis
VEVIVSLEQRFGGTPDGSVWADVGASYSFWQRYLEVFEKVKVLARVADVPCVPETWVRADGKNVTFIRVPHYVGALEYARRFVQVRGAIRGVRFQESAVIMRVPSFIASHVTRMLVASSHPFGVEIVGDPYDVFAPGTTRHPLRPYLRWSLVRQLRQQCMRACAAAYVTEYTLQRRYPSKLFSVGVSDVHLPSAAPLRAVDFETHFSSVDLRQGAFACGHRRYPGDEPRSTIRVLTVGSLEQPYKGIHHLLAAVQLCTLRGLDVTLTVVGDGRTRSKLERQSVALGLRERVTFLGKVPSGPALWVQMEEADLFVLASLTEGLPRAMIEAMARGMPCIGTHVGGVPELLAPEDIVPPGDPFALSERILEVTRSKARMSKMSAANLAKAGEFHELKLHQRRLGFYCHLHDITNGWLGSRKLIAR